MYSKSPSDHVSMLSGFEAEALQLEEPKDEDSRIEITIIRTGGTLGYVAVEWMATLGGEGKKVQSNVVLLQMCLESVKCDIYAWKEVL